MTDGSTVTFKKTDADGDDISIMYVKHDCPLRGLIEHILFGGGAGEIITFLADDSDWTVECLTNINQLRAAAAAKETAS